MFWAKYSSRKSTEEDSVFRRPKTEDQSPKPMTNLVECVPNFSEGRKPDTVDRIVGAIESVETTCVLDTHIDPDHNRSVITFVAAPERIVAAAVRAVAMAADSIDMRTHRGEHPRLGAT